MASRKITLKVGPSYARIPKELYEASKRKIGGKITRSGEALRGLTPEEEAKWIAPLLNISPTDKDYRKVIAEYWSNISIEVDVKSGLELEVGLDESNEPINLRDYIKYRYLMKCPEVGVDENDMRSDPSKRYYIEDFGKVKEENHKKLEKRKESYKEFIKLTADEKNTDKIDFVFRLMFEKNPNIFDRKDKDLMLEKISQEDPVKFLACVRNENLELESLISEAVSAEVIRKFGDSYSYLDMLLGNKLESCVAFLKDKKNSETLFVIREKVKEFSRMKPQTA